MHKKPLTKILTIISALILSAYYSEAHAGAFTVFGPKTCIREKGKPEKITETFYIRSIAGNYKLIVENGLYSETEEDDDDADEKKKDKDKDKEKEEKKTRVSSAEIEINGKEVIEEDDFNKKVVRIERTILLNHGNNTIEVEVKGKPGAFITVKIEGEDSVPPSVTITSPVNNTYLNTPSITVTGNTSDSISWIESVKVNGIIAPLTGESYTASNIQLVEGANTITATATDAAGNTGSASIAINLDTISPQIILDPVQSITNNPQFTITGRVLDASPVTALTINGTPVSLTNNFFTVIINLVEGNNTVAFAATDAAGNIGSTNATVLLDTAPPTITISTPANNTTLNTPSITVTGTVSDTLSGVSTVTINGINAVINGDTYTASNIPLVEGVNTITATASDRAGNTATSSITVNLDTTPPVISITSPVDGSTVNTDTITVTGTIDDNTATVTVNGVNVAVTNNIFTAFDILLIQGANTITATATDKANLTSSDTVNITYTPKAKRKAFIFPEPGFDNGGYSGINGPVEIGDINRDGNLDVITGNNDRISAILGKGDGSFEAPITFTLTFPHDSDYVSDIAIGNFNGDNNPDMAIVDRSSNRPDNLYIFLGNGDGTFSQGINYITTTNTDKSILIGNFNGDRYEDIAIVNVDDNMNINSDKILFFYGNGDGTFLSPVEMRSSAAYPTRGVTSDDFNSDGATDMAIIAGDSNWSEVVLLMGNGDGTFQSSVILGTESNINFEIEHGDFNGDGYLDLFITRQGQYNHLGFTVLMGDGRGGFPQRVDHETGLGRSGGGIIKVNDLNGDRKSDILISTSLFYSPDNKVLKFLGKGDGTFETPMEFNITGISMNIGDFDNDGIEDIVTAVNARVFILFAKGDGTFIDRKEIHGAGSYSILSADYDGDNTPDLAIPGDGRGTLFYTVLNKGNNSFKEPFQDSDKYWVGDGPISVKMGDLNDDGHIDVVTANELSGDISVLLNNGDGRLKTPVAYKVGQLPNFITIEDLNGDTHPDIITTNYSSNDISILLGRGDGQFQNQQSYAVGPNPRGLVVGDFNRDGKSDIAVSNSSESSNYISILLGNGDGTFQPQRTHTIDGKMPSSLVKGDFNEDGFMDLTVLNYSLTSGGSVTSSFITLLLGRGDGTFSNKVVYTLNWIWINAILSKDLNKDGKPDLIAVTDSTKGTIILLGDGDGQFERKSIIDSGWLSTSLGDFNNDGEIDILDSWLGIWLGQGDGTFKHTTSIGSLVYWGSVSWALPSPPAIGDINGDGISDIAVVDYERLSIIPGNGNGRFPGITAFNNEEVFFNAAYYSLINLATGDFNRDNNQDIIASMYPSDWYNYSTGKTILVPFYGTGYNTFIKGATIETQGYWGGRITAADFNEDGVSDIALAHSDIKTISIFLNRGDGTFENSLSYPIQSNVGAIEVGDINRDGHIDILIPQVEAGSYSLSIHTGNGDGTFQYQQRIPYHGSSSWSGATLKDFNSDGFLDMAVSDYSGKKVDILINNSGTFNTSVSYEVNGNAGFLIAEDFNKDGIIDIAVNKTLSLSILIGKGDGTFKPAEDYGNEGFGRMVSRDFNLDGLFDIVHPSGRTDDNNTQVLFNTLPPLFTPPSPPDILIEKGGDGIVSLTWTQNKETDVIGYNIYRSLSAGGGYVKLNDAPITSLSYTDTTVSNGIIYYYTISAVDRDGDESSYTQKIKTTPNPPDTTPPVVNIITPADGKTVTNPSLFISGTIDDPDAKITVNGITGAVQKSRGTFTAYEIPVKLGENIITVTATDTSNNTSSHSIKATYTIPAALTGTIKNELTGEPLYSAEISVTDSDKTQTATTDLDGKYNIVKIIPGEVTITVSAYGYSEINTKRTLTSGESFIFDAFLSPAATLTGWVYDATLYIPIDGATVTVTDPQKTHTAITNIYGEFTITGIFPSSAVTISVSKQGYETYTNSIWIRGGENYFFAYLDKAPPSASTGLTAVSGDGYIELSWNKNPEDNIMGYNIYKATSSGRYYYPETSTANLSYRDIWVSPWYTYYYVITAVDTQGRESNRSNEVSVTPSMPRISLYIGSPEDGMATDKSSIIVDGWFDTASNEVGVVIEVSGQLGTNRYIAHVNGWDFISLVELQEGTNTIRVIAADDTGYKREAIRTVYATIIPDKIKLTVTPNSGILNTSGILPVTFEAEVSLPNSVTNYSWDFDGDGIEDINTTDPIVTGWYYQYTGGYFPTVTATDTLGNTYTATTVVYVLDRDWMDMLLKSKWEGMKTALMNGDVEGALGYFLGNSQERYRDIFTNILNLLPTIVANMQSIEMIYVESGVAQYRIRRTESVGEVTYYLYFVIDENGLWKIQQF